MAEKEKTSSLKSSNQSNKSSAGIKVGHKDFVFGKLLGEGSFSSVYLAKHISTDIEYAVKVCEKLLIMKERKIDNIYREREVMNKLNSNQDHTAPFFVHLAYAFTCDTNLYFAMTYCKNGELLKWIKKVGNFDRSCASFYAGEIVKALEHLHSLGIIHRDIKPENIILYEDMHIKITDFGSAKLFTGDPEKDRRSSFVGTAQYVSPEVLESKPVSRASDLWALGCVIYQMISGLSPFNEPTEYLIIKSIQKVNYVFPEGFDKDAKDLVKKLLVTDKEIRLGSQDGPVYNSIRSHPFFNDWDLDTLYLQTPPVICGFIPEEIVWQENMAAGLVPEVIQWLEFGSTATSSSKTPEQDGIKKDLNLSLAEHKIRLDEQRKNNDYHNFVEEHLILKQGLLDKRKGLFARRRMFLLTTGPKLYYVDPDNRVLKGKVPLDETLRIDPKNFKTFFVHTPVINRTYYLEDPNGTSHEWCQALETVRDHYFPPNS